MQSLIRAVVVAGASLAAAWWLLHDSAEQEGVSSLLVPSDHVVESRADDQRRSTMTERAAGENLAGTEMRSATSRPDNSSPVLAIGASDTVEPIPLIEGITLPGGMWNLHTMMEREPRDAAWADEMERQFSTYFASKPELKRNYSQPSVLCRSRFCEIQAVGYGPRAFDTWKVATEDLRDQPWGSNLRAGGIYTIERAPNEQAVVLILMRQPLVQRVSEAAVTPPAK